MSAFESWYNTIYAIYSYVFRKVHAACDEIYDVSDVYFVNFVYDVHCGDVRTVLKIYIYQDVI